MIGSDKMEISNGNVRLLYTKDKIPFLAWNCLSKGSLCND